MKQKQKQTWTWASAVQATKRGDAVKTVQENPGHTTSSFQVRQASADRMEEVIQSVSAN